MYSKSFSFEGWNLIAFIKGRKKIIVAIVGYIGGYIVTKNPATSAMVAGATELIYAVIEYYCKKQA